MKKKDWEIVEEMNDDDDNPTCWQTEVNHKGYWITIHPDNLYHVEVQGVYDYVTLKVCKSFQSAKRWIAMNIK